MKTYQNLQGQTVLVIGGSSGIGFGIAKAALQNGASKVIIGSSSPDKVAAAVKRLESDKAGGKVVGITIDCLDLDNVERVVKDVGVINHLAYTSGDSRAGMMRNVKELDLKSARDVLYDVRYWAAVQAARTAQFPPEGGSITFTSGVNSFKPMPGWTLPSSVGAAILGATKALAVDLAPNNIRVNVVSAGWIDTEIFSQFDETTKKAMLDKASKRILAGRVGTPEDIAEAYIFLMKCGFITGETIKIDGGQLLTPDLEFSS